MIKPRSLASQFWIAGAIVFAFAGLSVSFLVYEINRHSDISTWLDQVHRTSGQLKFLLRDYYRARIDVRNHIRSGSDRDLKLFEQDKKVFSKTLESIVHRGKLDEIAAAYSNWLTIVEMPRKTLSTEAHQEKEKAAHTAVVQSIQAAISFYEELLNNQGTIEKNKVRRSYFAIAGVCFLLLMIFAILLYKLHGGIARPIAALTRGIEKYHGGEFDTRVQVTRRDEIGFLENSFNEMAESIESMVSDLKKLDQLKSEFLSTVSHELRTPLTSIGGYIKLILGGDAGEVNETQREFLQIADKNVQRLTELINDLLDVEKIESGKLQLVREIVDVRKVLHESVETFRLLAQQKGLELELAVPTEPVEVMGDRSRLMQVFLNLISNAVKYTEKGQVRVSAEITNFGLVARVSDTGAGISEVEQDHLFQKFYRTRSALKSDVGGTGLGLVIVQRLVEAHNGTIRLESTKGEGSTFLVSIPLISVEEKMAEKMRLEAEQVGIRTEGKETVWLVCPDVADREQMREYVGDFDEKLHTTDFATVKELLSASTHLEKPRMVLIDEKVSKDIYLTELLEVRKRLPDGVPIAILGQSANAMTAFQRGASALITRPLKRERFLAAIRNLMSAKAIKILIAQSDRDVRFLIKRSLEQRGFVVDDVERGQQVLKRLESEKYNLVIVESEFPDLPGVELLKFIRKENRFQGLEVMVIFEDEDQLLRKEMEDLGVHRFIPKEKGIDPIVDGVCEYMDEA